MIVTTSWDDGHPSDLRLAELLVKRRIAGTFYVPRFNREGRPVLTEKQVLELSSMHELGAHTLDHVELTKVPSVEAQRQIVESKKWLESIVGTGIEGFCYVRGSHDKNIRQLVKTAGYKYSRTVQNLCIFPSSDPLLMPTTLQLYPHTRVVYLKNLVKYGVGSRRIRAAFSVIFEKTLHARAKSLASLCGSENSCFHLWGHSWEIDELGLWHELDDLLYYLSEKYSHSTILTIGKTVSTICQRG